MKKILALVACLSLVASLAVGGSIAYLQDQKSDVNVMALGNVTIEQNEYERVVNADGTYEVKTVDDMDSYVLQGFSQSKPLLPIVGDPNEPGDSPAYKGWDDTTVRMSQVDSYGGMQVFAGKNAQDKFVTVKNTGKSDAFVRTIVAIEVGSTDGKKIMTSGRFDQPNAPWVRASLNPVEIDGNNYMVFEYVYRGASDVNRHVNGVLPAGETTYPSLAQVYLKHNADNDDMVAIDGNENGVLDIIVLSQAVQAAGFENAKTALDIAFGEFTAANVKAWMEDDENVEQPEVVDTVEEMAEALKNGGKVILGGNITVGGNGVMVLPQVDAGDIVIDGAGFKFTGILDVSGGSQQSNPESVTIKNVNFVGLGGEGYSIDTATSNATRYVHNLTVENCTFSDPNADLADVDTWTWAAIHEGTAGGKNWVIKDCTVNKGMHSLLQIKNVDGVVVDNCKVYSKNGINLNSTPSLEMTDCTFAVKGYAARFGVDKGGDPNSTKTYVIKDSTLETDNTENDPVIIFRNDAANKNSTLKIQGTTKLIGTTLYKNGDLVNIVTE